jgi:RHS repeat-associated protein
MMKSILTWITIVGISIASMAQSADQNYIKTTTYKVETLTPITEPALNQAIVQVSYFDGLGRPIQNIAKGQSADDKNIVNHIEYDEYGQQTQEFLPYENDNPNLNYISGAKDQVLNFYNNQYYQNTTNPYSKSLLENSPLNRVLKQAAPGNAWEMGSGHEIKFDYQTNIVSDEVIAYKAEATWNNIRKLYNISLLNSNIYYDPNLLNKNVTWDENNATGSSEKTEEFKDNEGRVVLKRVWAKVNGESLATKHDTYYVYDQFGNLTYVIPPAVLTINSNSLEGLCYQYKYDERNRLVAKKIPGKQWEFIVYDKLDRVRATGPVLSPFTNLSGNGWLITKYDAFNRPILTAWMPGIVSESTRKSTQDDLNLVSEISDSKTNNNTILNGIAYSYTNFSYPISNYHVLTVNYYDDYNYPNSPTNFDTVFGQDVRTNVKGLPTGSWIRVLETSTNYIGNLSYTQYKTDRMSSPIKNKTIYHTGGYTQTESAVNFAGEVEQTITKHKKTTTASDIVIAENFTYSDQGRLLTHTHQINNEPIEFLNINSYDKLGQLISKEVGGSGMNTLQTVNYTYNIRGWLTDINDVDEVMDGRNKDLFTFRINYQTPKNNATALFNGNISETYWKTRSDNQKRMYQYEYDGLNRLENASFENLNQNIVNTYNETLTYDKNGNITSLFRTGGYENPLGALTIDNLNYQYNPYSKNQLKKVVDLSNSLQGFKDDSNGTLAGDTSDDYLYDSNGNMTKDENKNITSIVYNHLNLPTKIIFGTGSTSSNITYTYDATGVKLKKVVTTTSTVSTTEYLNGFQYNNNILQFFPTSEGYVNHTFDTVESKSYFNYVYNYTDHLGNIRLSYTWDEEIQDVNILEENHYYPFGLKHDAYNETKKAYDGTELISLTSGGSIKRPIVVQVPNSGYQYQYNGKEWQDELGLDWYDYGARNYDAALGRFFSIDPISDQFGFQTPFAYAANNPVYFIDKNGNGPNPPNYIRIILYGGAKADSHNVTFKHAANNISKDYTDVDTEPQKFSSAKDIIKVVNSQNDNSVQSLDIVSHGGPHAIYAGADGEIFSNNSLYDSNYKQMIKTAYIDGGDIGEFDFNKFTENAKVEFHGCQTAVDTNSSDKNIVADFSKLLFDAGKTNAVAIGHVTSANPLINGIPVLDKEGNIIDGTKNEEQDYRHGKRAVYHNGEVLFYYNGKGRISADTINKYLDEKNKNK